MEIVYFSNVSENTHRFVQKLGRTAHRLPVRAGDPALTVTEPYVLIVPTYGGGNEGGAVPKQVIRFLNNEKNRTLLAGVIASGNTNFGATYCLAGEIIAKKCNVPVLHKFELLGTPEDLESVIHALSVSETNGEHDTH